MEERWSYLVGRDQQARDWRLQLNLEAGFQIEQIYLDAQPLGITLQPAAGKLSQAEKPTEDVSLAQIDYPAAAAWKFNLHRGRLLARCQPSSSHLLRDDLSLCSELWVDQEGVHMRIEGQVSGEKEAWVGWRFLSLPESPWGHYLSTFEPLSKLQAQELGSMPTGPCFLAEQEKGWRCEARSATDQLELVAEADCWRVIRTQIADQSGLQSLFLELLFRG